MIIDITRCNRVQGYLPKATQGFFNPFFATANVAFRREALQQAGGFDPNCQTGEDVDLSIRISRAGWELWYEPGAVVNHQDPHTFPQLLRQWFGYGYGHPYVFRKHLGRPRLQMYWRGGRDQNSTPYGARCLVDLPFPFYGVIFLERVSPVSSGSGRLLDRNIRALYRRVCFVWGDRFGLGVELRHHSVRLAPALALTGHARAAILGRHRVCRRSSAGRCARAGLISAGHSHPLKVKKKAFA